ncbi:hypothetical protein PG990_007093 [Apiospora arundinis]
MTKFQQAPNSASSLYDSLELYPEIWPHVRHWSCHSCPGAQRLRTETDRDNNDDDGETLI